MKPFTKPRVEVVAPGIVEVMMSGEMTADEALYVANLIEKAASVAAGWAERAEAEKGGPDGEAQQG